MDIRSLPQDVRSYLKSGTNINSISQCIMELVLNSLDAKSTAIAIRLNLITFRIQVVDNGKGITKSNMNLAGIRHMTSKCQSLADLKKIKRFGFRGEALASICNMSSKVTIASRSHDVKNTYSKTYENSKWNLISLIKQRPSQGTTITIENFMHNLPVRQKRINHNLDLREIKRGLESLTVIHPNVSFNLRNDANGKIDFQSNKSRTVSQALVNLCSDISIDDLIELKVSKNKICVSGLIYIKPSTSSRLQFVYLNKRPIVSPQIQNLLNSLLMKSLIFRKASGFNFGTAAEKKEYPVYMLNVHCPYSEVDLLLSPSKQTVEFRHWDVILKCVEKAVVRVLEQDNLIDPKNVVQEKLSPAVPYYQSQFGVSQIEGAVKSMPAKRKIIEKDYLNENNNIITTVVDVHNSDTTSKKRRTLSTNDDLSSDNKFVNVKDVTINNSGKCLKTVAALHGNKNKFNCTKRNRKTQISSDIFSGEVIEDWNLAICDDSTNKNGNLFKKPKHNLVNKSKKSKHNLKKYEPTKTKQISPNISNFHSEEAKSSPKTNIFDKHMNTQSLVLNSDNVNESITDNSLLNATINTDVLQDQEKGKSIIMDMFLKSTIGFPNEQPEITAQTLLVETTKQNLVSERKNHNTTTTVSLKILSKTVVTNSIYPLHDTNENQSEKRTKKCKEKMVSKCIQTTMIEQQKEFKINVETQAPKTRQTDQFNVTFNKYFKSRQRDTIFSHRPDTSFNFNQSPNNMEEDYSNNWRRSKVACFGNHELQSVPVPHFGTMDAFRQPRNFNIAMDKQQRRCIGPNTNFPCFETTDFLNDVTVPLYQNYNPRKFQYQDNDLNFINRPVDNLWDRSNNISRGFCNPQGNLTKLTFNSHLQRNFDAINLDEPAFLLKNTNEGDFLFKFDPRPLPTDRFGGAVLQPMHKEANLESIHNRDCDRAAPHNEAPFFYKKTKHYPRDCHTAENYYPNKIIGNRYNSNLQDLNADYCVSPFFHKVSRDVPIMEPTRTYLNQPKQPAIARNYEPSHKQTKPILMPRRKPKEQLRYRHGEDVRTKPPQQEHRMAEQEELTQKRHLFSRNTSQPQHRQEKMFFFSTEKAAPTHHNEAKCYSPFLYQNTKHHHQDRQMPENYHQKHHQHKIIANQNNSNLEDYCVSPFFRKISRGVPIMEPATTYINQPPIVRNYEPSNKQTKPMFYKDTEGHNIFLVPRSKSKEQLQLDIMSKAPQQRHIGLAPENRMTKQEELAQKRHLFSRNASQPQHRQEKMCFMEQNRFNGLDQEPETFFAGTNEQRRQGFFFPTERAQESWQVPPLPVNSKVNRRSKLSLKKFDTEPPQQKLEINNFFQSISNKNSEIKRSSNQPKFPIKKYRTAPFSPDFLKNYQQPASIKFDFFQRPAPVFIESSPQRDLTTPNTNVEPSTVKTKEQKKFCEVKNNRQPSPIKFDFFQRPTRPLFIETSPERHKESEYDFTTPNINKSSTQSSIVEQIDLSLLDKEVNTTLCSNNFQPKLSSTHFEILADGTRSEVEAVQKNYGFSSDVIEGTPTNLFVSLNQGGNYNELSDSNNQELYRSVKLDVTGLLKRLNSTTVSHQNTYKPNSPLSVSISAIKKSELIKNGMVNTYNQRSESGESDHTDLINLPPAPPNSNQITDGLQKSSVEDCWSQKIDRFGNVFYIHKRTGMTLAHSPKQDSHFNFIRRYEFVPKGLSPILVQTKEVDVSLSPSSKQSLHAAIMEEYENELGTIKWWNYIHDYKDANKFFEEMYREKTKQFECIIPNAGLSELPKSTIKLCNNLHSKSFTKAIFDDLQIIGQLDNKFIVTFIISKKLIVLFDQHAVHERVRLENLLNDYKEVTSHTTKFRSTKCDEKLVINLVEADVNVLINFQSSFIDLGLSYCSFDKGIEVSHIPTCVYNKCLQNDQQSRKTCIKNIINSLINEQISVITSTRGVGSNTSTVLQNIINLEACRGAIKFGDKLILDQCVKHLKSLADCKLPFQCAHGRPTLVPIVELTKTIEENMRPNLKKLK